MGRWIDADALPRHGKRGGLVQWKDIAEAPSIDIVRCKECKYWVSDGGALMICDIHKDPTVPDHFCSYGEKESE